MKFRVVERDKPLGEKRKKSIEEIRESVTSEDQNIRVIDSEGKRYVTIYRNYIKVAAVEITEGKELDKDQIKKQIQMEINKGSFDRFIRDEYNLINRGRAKARAERKKEKDRIKKEDK